jgi:MoaA/NifB/PqqE/SkfB family radical SAM enzyme
MKTERVFTNLRCNQACTYCTFRRAEDDLRAIQPSAMRASIDAALATGAREIVLTGGEPTLRRDLPLLVEHVAGSGALAVLATNATLIDAALAVRLRQAGLSRAVVNLAGASSALDAVTRDPGGFERTTRGIAGLTRAGVPVEIEAAIVRSTLPSLEGLPAEAARLGASALVLTVPTESPNPEEIPSWTEACGAVTRVERAARQVGLPVRFALDSALPPCAFPPGSRLQHLYSSLARAGGAGQDSARRDGFRHVAECEECLVRDGCPGIAETTLARAPRPGIHPVREERVRRRLSLVSSVSEQVKREIVSRTGGAFPDTIVRVNFHCNQSCTFCFVSTHLPAPPEEMTHAAILDAAKRGTRVVLSGGEPTLNPRLAEWVRLAKSLSSLPVQLQTNAVKLEDAELARSLVDAGLDEAFVSLHGATAEVSDRVTEAPGTFAKTLLGIDRLAETRVQVTLNFVLCGVNHHEAPDFVELVAARWPRALVNFSFVAPSSDLVPRTTELIPRYADVLPSLAVAMERAKAKGLRVVGLESMCGLPLCLVPGSVKDLALTEIPPGEGEGEFVKGEECRACGLESRCYGLRRGYAAMYGDGELRRQNAPLTTPWQG